MLPWLTRNRRWLHGGVLVVALGWGSLAALAGNAQSAVTGALVALSQALLFYDARAGRRTSPPKATASQRSVGIALVVTGLAVMMVTFVIFLTA